MLRVKFGQIPSGFIRLRQISSDLIRFHPLSWTMRPDSAHSSQEQLGRTRTVAVDEYQVLRSVNLCHIRFRGEIFFYSPVLSRV
jgi:hypothetical protein